LRSKPDRSSATADYLVVATRHNIRRRDDDFTVRTQQKSLKPLRQLHGHDRSAGAIAGVSLLVGGIES